MPSGSRRCLVTLRDRKKRNIVMVFPRLGPLAAPLRSDHARRASTKGLTDYRRDSTGLIKLFCRIEREINISDDGAPMTATQELSRPVSQNAWPKMNDGRRSGSGRIKPIA